MFNAVYSYFFGANETHLTQEEARSILNSATKDDTSQKQEEDNSDNVESENATFHKIGVITAKNHGNTYTIDNLYKYECCELNGNVGDRVSYISYVSDRKLHVTRVSVIESDWDTVSNDTKSTWCNRTLTVKVVQRKRREVIAEPGAIKINLNDVRSEFIPIVGDWLQVEAKCEIDEQITDLTGNILEVTKIKPLRLRDLMGVVRRWDSSTETGLIDRDVFFNFDSLSCGYTPCIGDKVTVEAVESEQNFCNWRAIKIIPYLALQKNNGGVLQSAQTFESNVEGIRICDGISLEFNEPLEVQTFSLTVCNETSDAVRLKEAEFANRTGQVKLADTCKNCVIPANCSIKISCKARPRNYGRTRELLLVHFEDYTIGRYITLTLKSQTQENVNNTCYNRNQLAFRERSHRFNNRNRIDCIPGQNTVVTPRFVAKQIGHHQIPDKLWDVYLNCSADPAALSETLLKKKPCLRELSYHCYEDYFHTLLHLEEIDNIIAMRKYDQDKACFITNGEYLMLEIENLSEQRPSIVRGDKIIASDPFSSQTSDFEGIVHKVGAKHVYLKFAPMFHASYNGEDYSVRVVSSRTQMRRSHHAVGLAMRNLGRELLFPNKVEAKPPRFNFATAPYKRNRAILNKLQEIVNSDKVELGKATATPRIEWYDKNLNEYQKLAVRNILLAEARPLPYFIFGPPGTGKTVTLVETILQILTLQPDARVLVGAPSNSAADIVATRLIDSGALKPGDLIRFVAYKCVADDLIPIKLIPYSATADITLEKSDHAKRQRTLNNGLTLGASCSVIGRHRVTVSTCSNLGTLFNMNFAKGHFTHIIIDEAGHLIEPDAMIALSFLDVSSGQAILAGDPLQLGPVVLSKIATEYGLSESYLERLMNRFPYIRDPEGFPESGGYDPKLVTKLVYNYRSLPDILAIPSKLFYNSELIPTISARESAEAKLLNKLSEILPRYDDKAASSLIFHGVEGENLQTPDSPSWFNPTEASQIFLYFNDFYRLGLKAEDMGIISPYVKQIQHIRSLLTEAEFELPKIGTVEEFQGQEFKVVLLSVVRSLENFVRSDVQHNLGFIFCPRRLNVAMTRAQVLLVIIGNPNILSQDPHWRGVLNYCIERGAYCGCPLNA